MSAFDSVIFQDSYCQLGEQFYSEQQPTPVAAPELIRFNHGLADRLNLPEDMTNSAELVQILAGNRVPKNSHPISTVYAAHQFGGWNPQLGDGRAILLGEVIGKDNKRYDIQLKGAGRTPYSRSGDGRSALGPVLREYILCEAMAALNISTTRALAAVSTGEPVVREAMLPGAIFTRVAQSHIRIGTFQFFSARDDLASVKALADYVIDRHFKDAIEIAKQNTDGDSYSALLSCVAERQAHLIAQWMSVGFIHGVMNTDNMLVCGETVDYGPCAFMDGYNPQKVFSSIDHQGRYAYANQSDIGGWNLSWFAQALLPLIDKNEALAITKAQDILTNYSDQFESHYHRLMAEKLGFSNANTSTNTNACDEVNQLVTELLALMAEQGSDYTLTFRTLTDQLAPDGGGSIPVDVYKLNEAFQPWLSRWQALLAAKSIDAVSAYQTMLEKNPAYIPRNHWVEAAIAQATLEQDFSVFHHLVDVLAKPYEYRQADKAFAMAPTPEQEIRKTFCGT